MTEIKEAGTQPVFATGHPCSKCNKSKCECDKTAKATDACC